VDGKNAADRPAPLWLRRARQDRHRALVVGLTNGRPAEERDRPLVQEFTLGPAATPVTSGVLLQIAQVLFWQHA
jgi:hypothetical protein